jgi:hypothetical protein
MKITYEVISMVEKLNITPIKLKHSPSFKRETNSILKIKVYLKTERDHLKDMDVNDVNSLKTLK